MSVTALLNYRHSTTAYISIHYSDSLPNTNAAKHKERGDKITVTELYNCLEAFLYTLEKLISPLTFSLFSAYNSSYSSSSDLGATASRELFFLVTSVEPLPLLPESTWFTISNSFVDLSNGKVVFSSFLSANVVTILVEVLTGEVVGVAVVSVFGTSVLNVDLDVDKEVVVFVTFVTAINDVVPNEVVTVDDVTVDVVTDNVATGDVDEVIANSAVINLEAGVDVDSMVVSSVVTASPKNA